MAAIEELEQDAQRRLAADVVDYFAGGAADERTLADNVSAWQRIAIRTGLGLDVAEVACSRSLLGGRLAAPTVLAPVAAQRLVHPRGELASARAAARMGTIFCLSTRSTTDLAEVAAEVSAPEEV